MVICVITRCYGVFCEPVDIIVLEDLKQEGFQMFDRHSVFDMTQVSKILQLLAKFHAASAVYVTKVSNYCYIC